jgi:hypothetical protein
MWCLRMSSNKKYDVVSEFWFVVIEQRIERTDENGMFFNTRKGVYLDLMRDMPHILKKWIIDNRPEDLDWFEKMMVLI